MHFLINGISEDTHVYNKALETVELMKVPLFSYKGNCEPLQPSSPTSVTRSYIVDQTIKVTEYELKYRQGEVDYWKNKRVIALIPLLASAILGGVGLAITPILPILGIAIMMSSVAFAILGLRRVIQAQHQKNKWDNDFLEHVLVARRNPSEKSIFEKKLRGTIFHPKEHEKIWRADASKFVAEFSSIKPKDFTLQKIDHFFTDNPLLKERRDYACVDMGRVLKERKDNECVDFARDLQVYRHLESYIDLVQSLYLDLKKQPHKLSKRYEERYQEIELKKANAIKSFDELRDKKKVELKKTKIRLEKEKKTALRLIEGDESLQKRTEITFADALQKVDDELYHRSHFHTVMISSIIAYSNIKKTELSQWYEIELKKIKTNKLKVVEYFTDNVTYICDVFSNKNHENSLINQTRRQLHTSKVSEPPEIPKDFLTYICNFYLEKNRDSLDNKERHEPHTSKVSEPPEIPEEFLPDIRDFCLNEKNKNSPDNNNRHPLHTSKASEPPDIREELLPEERQKK